MSFFTDAVAAYFHRNHSTSPASSAANDALQAVGSSIPALSKRKLRKITPAHQFATSIATNVVSSSDEGTLNTLPIWPHDRSSTNMAFIGGARSHFNERAIGEACTFRRCTSSFRLHIKYLLSKDSVTSLNVCKRFKNNNLLCILR